MSAAEDAKESLRVTAEFLTNMPHTSKRVTFVSDRINAFLNGKYPSLDQALGLKLGKGKYERPDNPEHLDKVCKALKMVFEDKKSWKTICELQGYERKDFERLWARYRSKAMEKMAEKIKIDLDSED